jgi:hypothetical protein
MVICICIVALLASSAAAVAAQRVVLAEMFGGTW